MSTANVNAIFNGVLPFDVNVASCDLITDLSVKDFNIVNISDNIIESNTLWTKVTPTLLRYGGGSATLTAGDSIQIRRKTPNNVVQPVTYSSRFSSDLWNSELDRIIRWREEADLNGVGTTGLSALPNNNPYSLAWGTDTISPPTRQALYQYLNSQLTSGFKNKLINGRFNIWQRGFTQAIPATAGANTDLRAYVADKWTVSQFNVGGTSRGFTVSRELHSMGQVDVADNPKYYLRINFTAAGAPSGNYSVRAIQSIEGVPNLSGKVMTLSINARSSIPGKFLGYRIMRNPGQGGSAISDIGVAGSWAITSTFKKYSVSFVMPSTSGMTLGAEGTDVYYVMIYFASGAAEVPADINFGLGTVDVSDVQLELGDSATAIDDVPFNIELLNCMRYYQQSSPYGIAPNATTFGGRGIQYHIAGTGTWIDTVVLPIAMATAPSVEIYSASFVSNNISRGGVSVPATVSSIANNSFLVTNTSASSASNFFYQWATRVDYV